MKASLLYTGATGFLGNNTIEILRQDYEVVTLGIPMADIICDLSNEIPTLGQSFDVVLHAAGKAHVVPRTEAEAKLFYDINLQGTINLCRGLEKSGLPKSFIFISTVAVYGCDTGENILEDHPLNGNTPYALSKMQAEQFLVNWAKRNNVILTIFRPSLIAGPNPPGNLGDMIKGIRTGRYLSIGGGKAKKSVLMAEDIAHLVDLAKDKGGIYNVCDDSQPSFRDLEVIICQQLGKGMPINVPYWIAKILAVIGDCLGSRSPINSRKLDKITQSLTFSNEKAKNELNWKPVNVIESFHI